MQIAFENVCLKLKTFFHPRVLGMFILLPTGFKVVGLIKITLWLTYFCCSLKVRICLQIIMEHVPCQSVNLLTTVKQIGTPVVKFKESQILHAFLLSPFDPDEET